MRIIPFEELYHTDFFISEVVSKPQNWFSRGNLYSAIGIPKPSHTLLWFQNCRGRITAKHGATLEIAQNQMAYMSKGIEYQVEFFDTAPDRVDTIVFHFQLQDASGQDIAPTLEPMICIQNVDAAMGLAAENAAEEFKKSIICLPEITAVIYQIFAYICKKQRSRIAQYQYSYIRTGIELLENDCDLSITEIARRCGVSEGYFRRLFREYSGDNPIDFRQKHRIEKAKQLLLLDLFSVGEVARELHFADIYHFSKTFKKFTGLSPKEFVRSHMTDKKE